MKRRFLLALCTTLLAVGSLAFGTPPGLSPAPKEKAPQSATDFKTLMQKELDAWATLDPANAAPFYAKDANFLFFDIAPLKYAGWNQYAEGVKKVLAPFASAKFTLGDDVQTYQRGGLAWGASTLRIDFVNKDGSKETLDTRWTVVWEKRGSEWLVVHEHTSAPLPEAPAMAGQSLYKRLGGYDAIAAVTDDFIGRLANDPKLSHFFAGHSTDTLKRIRQLVADQLCNATGGPCFYIGRDMKSAHAGLGITEDDWKASVDHLVATLDKFKVPQKEKDEVLGALSGLKADIVSAPAGGQK